MSTCIREDKDTVVVFTVEVESFGPGDSRHQNQIARTLWTQLNRGFGADRVKVWHNGKRVYFDPTAYAIDEDVSVVERLPLGLLD